MVLTRGSPPAARLPVKSLPCFLMLEWVFPFLFWLIHKLVQLILSDQKVSIQVVHNFHQTTVHTSTEYNKCDDHGLRRNHLVPTADNWISDETSKKCER